MNHTASARALRLKANQIVHIINAGDQTVYEMFDGDVYKFPPKSWAPTRAEIAWLWLGNPDYRNDMSKWHAEVSRLANRVGEAQWAYRQSGNFYCKEFGRAGEFYGMPKHEMNPVVVAQSLDTLEDLGSDLVITPDISLLDHTGDDLTANVRVAPKAKK